MRILLQAIAAVTILLILLSCCCTGGLDDEDIDCAHLPCHGEGGGGDV